MKNNFIRFTAISLMFGAAFTACSGGGSNSSTTSSTTSTLSTGFDVPTEISAVPTNQSGSSKAHSKGSLKSAVLALYAATDAGTDYSNAVTVKFVNEQVLEQFGIIEQVLNALAQTKYGDAANINAGPYKAMVAWQDEQNGIQTKSLEPWVVDSAMIIENGVDVNRVRVWIEQAEDGAVQVVKAEFKITASATRRSDGSYSDYGAWTMNVKFGDSTQDFFVASAEIGSNGESIIRVHERFPEGEGFTFEAKAIMQKADSEGFGKVSFPDWESCTDYPCAPQTVSAKYAYNANHMAVQKDGSSVLYKDRSSVTEMTHRYGLYDGETGQDVFKIKNFGFPVTYSVNGINQYAYYGAWQGRHQLWSGNGTVAEGTTVTREDRRDQTTAETYTVSAPISGTLVKRSTVDGSLNDILNIPVETWINKQYNIRFSASPSPGNWNACVNPNWDPNTGMQTCGGGVADFTSTLPLLEVDAEDNRKWVNINRWDQSNGVPIDYVYLSNGPSGAGFYLGERNNQTGQTVMASPASKYTPSDGEDMWVNIGGSIYIEYTINGWMEKKVSSFDQRNWSPEFDASGDSPYTLPLNEELYINSRGTNYIVKRTGTDTYTVKLEIQTVANPVNVLTFVPANTVFKSQWNADNDSTYTFDTDSTSSTFMKLVYASIGDNDRDGNGNANTGISVGAVVTTGLWGLVAYVDGTATTTQYNWDYPRDGEDWGKVTYLLDSNGDYVLLSDPIRLLPVTVTNNAGQDKTLSLQYDGWMQGLPDLFEELRKKDFVMDSTISDKIINIPAGTLVTDAADSTKSYLIKPLEISQFLTIVSDPGTLDISAADTVDLSTVPDFVEHNMGTLPETTGIKYSEGRLLE